MESPSIRILILSLFAAVYFFFRLRRCVLRGAKVGVVAIFVASSRVSTVIFFFSFSVFSDFLDVCGAEVSAVTVNVPQIAMNNRTEKKWDDFIFIPHRIIERFLILYHVFRKLLPVTQKKYFSVSKQYFFQMFQFINKKNNKKF